MSERNQQEVVQKPRSVLNLALQFLSRREYAREELRRKLLVYEDDEQKLLALLDNLEAKGFLSDERAAASLLRQKSSRLGQARLRQELQAKGFDKELMQESLQSLADSEFERAKQVWLRKFGSVNMDATDLSFADRMKLQAKQIRFLSSRGFSLDIARKVLDQAREKDD